MNNEKKVLQLRKLVKTFMIALLFIAAGMMQVYAYNVSVGTTSNGHFIDGFQLAYDNEVVTQYFIFSAPDGYEPNGGWGPDPEWYFYQYYQCDDNYWNYESSESGSYGSCVADKKQTTEGQIVTLTSYPLEHCRVDSWSVVKRGDGDVAVEVTPSLENPNQATFIMPAFDVEFSVTFTGENGYHMIYNWNACIEHGAVECPKVAMEGEEVSIHIGAIDEGYRLNYCLVSYPSNDIGVQYIETYDPLGVYNYPGGAAFNLPPFWMSDFTFIMPEEDVDIYASFVASPYVWYSLVTDVNDLVPGKHYIIVGDNVDFQYYMNEQGVDNRDAVITYSMGGVIRSWLLGEYESLFPHHEFVLSGSVSDKWTIYDENEESKGYLYAASSEENLLKTSTILTNDALWNIEIASDGKATIIAQGDNTHNILKFDSNGMFSCYSSNSEQNPVYIYKKMGSDPDYAFYSNSTLESLTLENNDFYGPVLDEYYYYSFGNQYQRCIIHSPAVLTITGSIANNTQDSFEGYWDEETQTWQEAYYSAGENLFIESGGQLIANNEVLGMGQKHIAAHDTTDGWNFIASPVIETITPDVNNGLFDANICDLYYYDEAEHYWRNYEGEYGNFDIEPQQGYLYANSYDTDLSFVGTLQPSNEAITISEDNLSCSSDIFTGFNLVGNPFPCKAKLNRSYYVIEGRNTVPCDASVAIDPCTGVMVQVTSDNKNVTFTRALPDSPISMSSSLLITVTHNAINKGSNSTGLTTLQDNAIVSFNEGNRLEKIVFNANAAKLYIPQDGKEYAIAVSEKQGEMPVNFHAARNGNYTLDVNPKGVEMNYLHLIDTMTGTDVDLLQTSTYNFNATISDNESRFRLVFSAGCNINN